MEQLPLLARPVAPAAVLLLGACDKPATRDASNAAPLAAAASSPTALNARVQALTAENAQLKAEVASLKSQVEALSVTPQSLLDRVAAALAADDFEAARTSVDTLEKRFAQSAQAKAARAQLAKAEALVQEKQALAKQLEARGFYALPVTSAPQVGGVTLKVESLELGDRWVFDAYGDEWSYRQAERGQRFVLLKTTVHSTNKGPYLPEVGVYRIDGKQMTHLARLRYEFRRWMSYGTYIGLEHDFRNDFAHTPAVSFNAAASIDTELTRQPLAVVATGDLCHERDKRIGQPEVAYTPRYNCSPKSELTPADFTTGNARVLAFFNKPKGL